MASQKIAKVDHKPEGKVEIPGSKSHANRALACACVASGVTEISRFLIADDTVAMAEVVEGLGSSISLDEPNSAISITGLGSAPNVPDRAVHLNANKSGTTARFIIPILAAGEGHFIVDGDPQLRQRPFSDLTKALAELGATIDSDHLPIDIKAKGFDAVECTVSGEISSQFLSGLMLCGPLTADGLNINILGTLVSKPYVDLTVSTMRSFGAVVTVSDDYSKVSVSPGGYTANSLDLEPDASAASYFFAAAAITGGSVTVEGLGHNTVQGDLAFVEALAEMGADVSVSANETTVKGTGTLKGISINMANFSDVAQTLAVVATYADSPTEITGIGFIKNKETDRVAATVTELRSAGIAAHATEDGLIVEPGGAAPTQIKTYEDHRMAMSFALLGLGNSGIEILDPGCVSKTFPNYFEKLNSWIAS